MCVGDGAGWGEGAGRGSHEAGAAEARTQQAGSVKGACVNNWLVARATAQTQATAKQHKAARRPFSQPCRRGSGAAGAARLDFGSRSLRGRSLDMPVLTVDG